MGRKKTTSSTSSTRSAKTPFKPFCFYCDRSFESEEVLIQHQKFRHFKCLVCNRKTDTASGLVVHMLQTHKESLGQVPHAMPYRGSPELKIHGMQGVPTDLILHRAVGTDLEDYINRGEVHLHPLFAAIKKGMISSSSA